MTIIDKEMASSIILVALIIILFLFMVYAIISYPLPVISPSPITQTYYFNLTNGSLLFLNLTFTNGYQNGLSYYTFIYTNYSVEAKIIITPTGNITNISSAYIKAKINSMCSNSSGMNLYQINGNNDFYKCN